MQNKSRWIYPKFFYLLIIGTTLISPKQALGARADYEECNAALASGLMDQEVSISDNQFYEHAINWACSLETKELKRVLSHDGNVGVMELVKIKGDWEESNYEDWRKEKCNFAASEKASSTFNYFMMRRANSSLIEAWKECIGKKTGMYCWAKPHQGNDIIIHINWRSQFGNVQPVIENHIVTKGLKVDDQSLPTIERGKKIAEGDTAVYVVREDPSRHSSFTIQASVAIGESRHNQTCEYHFEPQREDPNSSPPSLAEIRWTYKTISANTHTFRCFANNREVGNVIDCRTFGTCSNAEGNKLACAGSFYRLALASEENEIPEVRWSYKVIRAGNNHSFQCFADDRQVGNVIDCRTFGTCSNSIGNTLMCAGQFYRQAIQQARSRAIAAEGNSN